GGGTRPPGSPGGPHTWTRTAPRSSPAPSSRSTAAGRPGSPEVEGQNRPVNEPDRLRRKYDSPLRRQRAAETYDRIVAAGVAILHELPLWKWQALTLRAVAQRAGVTERTVYRHFATERELREV